MEVSHAREKLETTPAEKIRALIHHLFAHPARVASLATTFVFANELAKKKDLPRIFVAFLGHDIGKFLIENGIKMQKHPTLSRDFFEKIGLSRIAKIVFGHHEKWGGEGYPRKTGGRNIPFFSRILKIVDSFDAITSHRGYDPAHSIDEALTNLREKSGMIFDPTLVELFCKFVEQNRRLVEILLLKSASAKSG